MRCIDDKPNGIILNHNGDWSGEVRIAWYLAIERNDLVESDFAGRRTGPPSSSLHECWCSGPDLVAGRYSPVNKPGGEASHYDPPINVLTRAVALTVEAYLRRKMANAVEDLNIDQGDL